ncbi:hypothetical protein ACFVMC_00715 [Nocardia sp. NPDC127579]|uniref:hypothetical protein n=1 Tax=Nocardia sp. NPDC127579 TaxID=3345402 RepID=UPI003638E12F
MSGIWELTPIESWVAWETLGRRTPFPFPLTFAAEVETQVEFDLQRRAAADALCAGVNGWGERAMSRGVSCTLGLSVGEGAGVGGWGERAMSRGVSCMPGLRVCEVWA